MIMTRTSEFQILELLKSMTKTSDRIIEVLNRIEERLENDKKKSM